MKKPRVSFENSRTLLTWWCSLASCSIGLARCQETDANRIDNGTQRILAMGKMDEMFSQDLPFPPQASQINRHVPYTGDDSIYFRKTLVFESLDHVLNAITSARTARFDQIQLLLDTFHKDCRVDYDETAVTERYPFIALEGPEASGGAIVAKWLSYKLDAYNLTNPPDCLIRLRNEFDSKASTLRKLYYALGVWVNSELAKKFTAFRPVIINRYWRSMTAYGIAMENRKTGLPLPSSESRIYKFPCDLTVPDFNFYVNVSENTRADRLAFRRQSMSSDLVQTINHVYNYFKYPPTITLDGNKRVGDMLDEIASELNITYIR